MLHSKKKKNRVKKSRHNKKRNGGASLKPLDSGMFKLLTQRLLSDIPLPPRKIDEKIHRDIYCPAKMKMLENETLKRAERLHATSFRYCNFSNIAKCNIAKCVELNLEAVEQLKQAIDMGSLRARACLADMLLNGNTVGVRKNVREAMMLVSQVDDPDCQGVLAHSHFNDGIKAGRSLAIQSAAAGSKYGQLVVGLFAQQERNTKKAAEYFALAAAQNYDEAQIALSYLQSDKDEVMRLLTLAAEQGNKNAFFLIAENFRLKAEHEPGRYLHLKAMQWLNLAMDAEHPYAQDALSAMKYKYSGL
jgi:TPR repeat protein